MVSVKIKVTEFMPDRTQYKQYGIRLELENTLVEVRVPDEMVVATYHNARTDRVETLLTLDGLAYVARQVADAIDAMHRDWQNEQAGR